MLHHPNDQQDLTAPVAWRSASERSLTNAFWDCPIWTDTTLVRMSLPADTKRATRRHTTARKRA